MKSVVTDRYLRFVTLLKIEGTRRQLGIIRAAYELEEANILSAASAKELNTLYRWFNLNLAVPDRFSRSSKPRPNAKAISWFRSSAHKHISKARDLCSLLESHNMICEMVTTKKPGYVIYKDKYQVTAVPFKDRT